MDIFEFLIDNDKGIDYTGTKVYHGTSSKYIQNILKVGLRPNPNKYWANTFSTSREEKQKMLKELPKELYVTTDFDAALDSAKHTAFYGGKPIVLSFILNSKDTYIPKEQETELVLYNKISPNRLSVEFPKNFSTAKVKRNIDLSKRRTELIRSVNKILRKYNFNVRSGSKTTPRLLLYYNGEMVQSFLPKEIDSIFDGIEDVYFPNLDYKEVLDSWSRISSEDMEKIKLYFKEIGIRS